MSMFQIYNISFIFKQTNMKIYGLFRAKLKAHISSYYTAVSTLLGLSGDSDSKESACNAGDLGSIPGSRRSPREGNGKPLQYSCLENSMDRGAWWAAVHGISQSQAWLKWLSMHARRASSLLVFPFSGFPGYSCCLFFYVNFSIRLYISTRAY